MPPPHGPATLPPYGPGKKGNPFQVQWVCLVLQTHRAVRQEPSLSHRFALRAGLEISNVHGVAATRVLRTPASLASTVPRRRRNSHTWFVRRWCDPIEKLSPGILAFAASLASTRETSSSNISPRTRTLLEDEPLTSHNTTRHVFSMAALAGVLNLVASGTKRP